MTELRIEHLTWPDVAQAVAGGRRTTVLPLGATEQHGPHLPLSVDSEHADRLAVLIAERLGDALVLPTVRVGCSSHHLGFAGTLSLRPETLAAVCADLCTSLAAHSFHRLLIFSAHIGNNPLLAGIEAALRPHIPADMQVIAFSDTESVLDAWRASARRVIGTDIGVGGHADVAESSIMLALRPSAVRPERSTAGPRERTDAALLDRVFTGGVAAVSPSGVLGDPAGMSAELGSACLETLAERISEYYRTRYRPIT